MVMMNPQFDDIEQNSKRHYRSSKRARTILSKPQTRMVKSYETPHWQRRTASGSRGMYARFAIVSAVSRKSVSNGLISVNIGKQARKFGNVTISFSKGYTNSIVEATVR